MHAFEHIAKLYFEEMGFWVNDTVKIDITKTDKQEIGLPSMPRPEIDIVAYNVKENILVLVEVKSYLDSPGVRYDSLTGEHKKTSDRYRLFTDLVFQKIVSTRIKEQYLGRGLIRENTKIKFALVAGKIYSKHEDKIKTLFNKNGWMLVAPQEIKKAIGLFAEKGYEDNIVTIVAKVLR